MMTAEHMDRKKQATTVITAKDATRHKHELTVRGRMIIELAQQLAVATGVSAALHLRNARSLAEEVSR